MRAERTGAWALLQRHPFVIAYAAALVPGLVMALTQPVWSRIDEAPNADFIVQLSHGVYPVADTTLLDPETVRVMAADGFFSPLYPSAMGPSTGPGIDPTDTGPIPPGMSDHANSVWMARHLWELSRESDQTPGYFLLMAPVWWIVDRLGGTYAAIFAIRVIDALIIATLAPMAVAVARVLTPTRPEVAALAALFAILLPGLDLNGPRISNDALAAALGGLFVLLAVRWAGNALTWRRTILLGLVLGAGLMTKLTVAGRIPALAVAALWPAAGSSWRVRLARVLVALAIAVVCLGPWFLLNLHNYGGILPGARAARIQDGAPGSLTLPFIALDLVIVWLTYWTGEPWGVLPFALPFAALGGILALTVPPGVLRLLKARVPSTSAAAFAVAIAAVVGVVVFALAFPAAFRFQVVGAGRYAYPALPAAAALVAIGLCMVVMNKFARRAVATVYAVAAIGILGAGAAGWPAAPPTVSGPGMPPAGARIISVASSGELHGLSISVDRIAFDAAAHATWFEVTVTNSGPVEADWPVVPVATIGGTTARVDYLRSTLLPGDIDAGQSAIGWLFVAFDPARVHPGDAVVLRFPDVAVDDYAYVEDVYLRLDIAVAGVAG